jgi:hypothetical protein
MRDRQHVLIDHKSREVNDAIRRSVDVTARCDVDAAMARRVWCRGRNERTQDLVGSVHRPRPAGFGCGRGSGRQKGNPGQSKQHESCKSDHPLIVAGRVTRRALADQSGQNHPQMRPVGDRCYPFGSIQSNPDDYACSLPNQLGAHIHSVVRGNSHVWPCADTRFRSKRRG